METNIRNTAISKTFIFFGIIIFIISAIDLADLVMPLRLASAEWVFGITQSVIASVLAPALALVILLTGLYFADNSSKSKKLLNFEKIVGIVSFVFGLVLIANLLVYSLSMKSYETKVISSVKIQKDEVLNKINQLKNIPKLKISESIYTKKVVEINNAATQHCPPMPQKEGYVHHWNPFANNGNGAWVEVPEDQDKTNTRRKGKAKIVIKRCSHSKQRP